MSVLLQVRGLSKRFGGLAAVKDLDFDVADGEIVGLIGPNGAGKSTAFNLISGAMRPSAGSILFAGREIAGKVPSAVVAHGLARTFQSASVYAKATVGENLFRGALSRISKSLLVQATRRAAYRDSLGRLAEDVDSILEITGLAPYRDKLAGELAYGHQKRLGVAIGLATKPRLLLLDEPAAGLNPEECADFGRLLTRLKREHSLSLLFVEHHMALVMETCERIVVLVQGQKLAEGTPAEVRGNPAVVEAYLGTPDDADA
jgi:branched-chain amino acid transport system ATP-binding protein